MIGGFSRAVRGTLFGLTLPAMALAAANNGLPPFVDVPGPSNMPAPQRLIFFSWLKKYIDWWQLQCPLARGTTYYVDFTAGSDSNDGLSTAAPFKTLDKVTAVIAASGGNVRFRLACNEVWRVTTTGSSPNLYMRAIYGQVANVTIDSYVKEGATGTATNRPPIITTAVAIASGAWSTDATNVNSYKCTIAALTGAVNSVAWFREALDINEERVFIRRNSAAEVDANPGSFYYDAAAALLWMRPHLNGKAPTAGFHDGYEYFPQFRQADFRSTTVPGLTGADMLPMIYWGDVHGWRVHGVRLDGGCTYNDISTAAATQALRCDLSGTNKALVSGVSANYSHQHIMMKGDIGSAGGGIMFLRCVTNGHFAQEAANSRQVQDHLMSYSSLGGSIGMFIDCTGIMGRLPSVTYNDFSKQGEYIRTHTNGATTAGLQLMYRCKIKPNLWQPQSFGTFGNVVDWSTSGDMSLCRAFKIFCEFPTRPRVAAIDDAWWLAGAGTNLLYNNAWDGANVVWLGGYVKTHLVRNSTNTPNVYLNGNTAAQAFVNTLWEIDFGMCKADVASLGLGTAKCFWFYTHFKIKIGSHQGGSQPQFGLGKAYTGAGDTWANSAQNLKSVCPVYELVGMSTFDDVTVSGLGNNLDSGGAVLASGSERQLYEAYIGGFNSKGASTNFYGWVNVPGVVSAPNVEDFPSLDSALVAAAEPLVAGLRLEYDAYGTPRDAAHPTRGRVQAADYTNQPLVA